MLHLNVVKKTLAQTEKEYVKEYRRGANDCYEGNPTQTGESLGYLQGYEDAFQLEQIDTNRTLQGTH